MSCLSDAQINVGAVGIEDDLVYVSLPAEGDAALKSTCEGQFFPRRRSTLNTTKAPITPAMILTRTIKLVPRRAMADCSTLASSHGARIHTSRSFVGEQAILPAN